MRAVYFEEFGKLPDVRQVPDPQPTQGGAVIRVTATGLCRSDWHAWSGHDPDVQLPHVPGHELAGVVESVGNDVTGWRPGQRVTVPFVCGCGSCASCAAGAHQVCERQTQPGFTHWGSYAEHVAIENADVNLVAVPEAMTDHAAASLGCRFATAFRAVVTQAAARAGEWVVVYGCGGVGLSAVMIATACGARVVAVDVSDDALRLAERFGADVCVNGSIVNDTTASVIDATNGGAHVSVDALGSAATCEAAINSLRRHGRHVQVGLLPRANGEVPLPMDRVIAWELRVLGSHGMAAHEYPELLAMIEAGRLRPESLVSNVIGLDDAPKALATMNSRPGGGVTIIEP